MEKAQSTDSKTCKSCLTEKACAEFYRDRTTSDGLRGKCKECLAEAVKQYRKTPSGKRAALVATLKYQATERGREVTDTYKKSEGRRMALRKYQKTSDHIKLLNKTYTTVRRALKSGKLRKQPCERCGDSPADAHHEDYSKPLQVNWLCKPHHVERHREINATRNAS